MVIVITGATSGIGEATAEYLISKNYKVYSLARRIGNHPRINYISCDISSNDEIVKAFNEIILKEKHIDAIINNAGMGISGALEFNQASDIKQILDVNLYGLINVTRAAIPHLRKTKGRIINIGSVAGELAIPFQTMYSVTKAGVHIASEALANELRPFGIKVSCVMPGDTKTAFTQNRKKNEDDAVYQKRVVQSVSRMEKDEQNGASPLKVAKDVYKCLTKRNPPLKTAVGIQYKILVFIKRILPQKLVNYILYKMYAE